MSWDAAREVSGLKTTASLGCEPTADKRPYMWKVVVLDRKMMECDERYGIPTPQIHFFANLDKSAEGTYGGP